MLNTSSINHGIDESALSSSDWRPFLAALPVSFPTFAPALCLHGSHSLMIRSEEPGHLSNGFPSVDSSWVHGPYVQWCMLHATALDSSSLSPTGTSE